MGQILSQPVTDKSTEKGEDARLYFGVSSMQGWRVSMEDSHAAILDLVAAASAPAASEETSEETSTSTSAATSAAAAATTKASGSDKPKTSGNPPAFFGVYDGHGGDRTAIYAGANTHRIVAASQAFSKGNWGQALVDGFLGTDASLVDEAVASEAADDMGQGLDASGCAATAVIIIPHERIICGNAGDSRTVLGRLGTAKALSFDHKPDNEGERSRICAAGGFVDIGRVNGNLALSRALGDMNFKKNPHLAPEQQVVTACPDVVEHPLDKRDEFVVLACDGIWDCMTSQEVVEFVRRGVADHLPLEDICELLMEECLAPESDMSGVGCDNMTVCLVALFQEGQTKEQWYDMVAERVANGEGPVAERTSEQVRDEIHARSSHGADAHHGNASGSRGPHGESEEIEPSQLVLQQIFGGGDGSASLDADATSSLLQRIGIRFNMHMPEADQSGRVHEAGEDFSESGASSSSPEPHGTSPTGDHDHIEALKPEHDLDTHADGEAKTDA